MIRLAGAVNALEGYEGYKPITDEAVITAAPDVILMMDRGGDPDPSDGNLRQSRDRLDARRPGEAAGANGRSLLVGFGPRTAAAVRHLAAELYGDQVVQ